MKSCILRKKFLFFHRRYPNEDPTVRCKFKQASMIIYNVDKLPLIFTHLLISSLADRPLKELLIAL